MSSECSSRPIAAGSLALLCALAFMACERGAPSELESHQPTTAAAPSLSDVLSRDGFAALRMSDEERATLAAAIEASDWEQLPPEVYPERIRRFGGVEARIEGWMIPGTIKQRRVLDFMLVRDNAACCFGAMPGADEWIHVEMNEGANAQYFRYAKIAVTGVLEVGGSAVTKGLKPPALRMRASACEIIEKPR